MSENPEDGGQISGMKEVAVEAALEAPPSTPNIEALDIGLRLDQIANGMNSILSRMERQDQEALELRDALNRVREKLQRMEEASRKWDEEREQILAAAQQASDAVDPKVRQKAQAEAAKDVQSAAAALKANAAMSKKKFLEELKEMEQVEVVSPGKIVFVRGQQGTPTPTLMMETVAINGMKWTLPPNVPTKVPRVVAERLEQMRLEQEEQQQRRHVLSASSKLRNERELVKEWDAISERYGSPTADIPIAGGDV